jgi:putative tryptophan/tyrosine transport system substrate-binding protein
MLDTGRRQFIMLLGGAAAVWPLSARGQQSIPVIGFLTARGPGDVPRLMAAFHTGLKSAGFVEGQNVAIEYRFAESRNERLPALAADLVERQVTVIAAVTTPAALAAQAATTTTPIVFETGTDPIQLGLVASLNQPGGNVTGVTSMIVEVAPKRLELLHELLPTTTRMALLVNPADRALAQSQSREVLRAARSLGIELHIVNATSDRDFDAVFANLKRLRVGGLVIGPGSVTLRGIEQLAALTIRHAMPAIHQDRDFTAAGGLMSYGSDVADSYRLAGIYTSRILNGEKPADLPVQQASRFNLYLNLKTAKALGLTVPPTLLARADEVIE